MEQLEIGKIGKRGEDVNLKAIEAIVNILTKEKHDSVRLNVLKGVKQVLSKCVPTFEDKLLRSFDMESMFDLTSMIECNETDLSNYQSEYSDFLLGLIQHSRNFHEKLETEFISFIKKLPDKNKMLTNSFVRNIWTGLEKNSIIWPGLVKEILPFSHVFIEEKVFEWVKQTTLNEETVNVKYYAEASVKCEDLFQLITKILNEFVIVTEGNDKILHLVKNFVDFVSEHCDKIGETILKLYPRKYCYLISLLNITPEVYSDPSLLSGTDVILLKREVLKVLLSNYKDERNMVLQFLTHYPKWLEEFFMLLKKLEPT